jgi:ketosteroid isomerase-like protein
MTATDLTIDELLAVESIKNLRVLGSRHLDSGRVDELADIYTEDAVCEFGPYGTWEGRDTFAEKFAEAEKPFYASGYFSNLHVITNHAVELTGPDTATGLVYLLDFVTGDQMREGGNPLFWLGVYEEEYRRTGDGWRIARQSLSFIWPQRMLGASLLPRYGGPDTAAR